MLDRLQRPPLMLEILRACATYYNASEERIRGDVREVKIARVRHVAMFLCRIDGRKSYSEIGRYFNRDHTTVIAAHKHVVRLREEKDPCIEEELAAVRMMIVKCLELPTLCPGCGILRDELAELRSEVATLAEIVKRNVPA